METTLSKNRNAGSRGSRKDFVDPQLFECPDCDGSGEHKSGKDCPTCSGAGSLLVMCAKSEGSQQP
jgi:DnaJ-class molecular chaperone